MQRIAPHTLPPQGVRPGGGQSPMEKNQPLPPALLLARRIRREQGAEQVRRFLVAMEPFLAPNERMTIAEQLGIRLPQKAIQTQRGGTGTQESGLEENTVRPPQPQQNNMNGGFAHMAQQLQLMQMLSQLSGQGGGFNPALLSQLMSGMNGGMKR